MDSIRIVGKLCPTEFNWEKNIVVIALRLLIPRLPLIAIIKG